MTAYTGKPDLTTLDDISNDGFWPDLSMAELVESQRIPAEYADNVIKTQLVQSIIRVNGRLSPVKAAINALADGSFADYLEAIDAYQVNGEYSFLSEYKTAVFAHAKALLLQQLNTLNRAKVAENAAKEAPETFQYWMDASAMSIHALTAAFAADSTGGADYGFHAALI